MELSSSGSSLSLDSWRKSEKSTPSRSPSRTSVPQTLLSLPSSQFNNLNISPSNVQRTGSRSSLDPIMGNFFAKVPVFSLNSKKQGL